MQFHQVRYFLAACDTMNFTRASEVCHVSQPALTVAIRKLEEELGGELFVRDNRQLRLTELGRSMRTHLGRLEETRNAARQAASKIVLGEMEMIDLGLMCTLSPGLLTDAIMHWQANAPHVELLIHDVWGQKARELLLSGVIDCALIARTAPLPDRFEARALLREPMIVATSKNHFLGNTPKIKLNDLEGLSYVDRLRCEFRTTFFEELQERNLSVDVVLRSEREDWMCEAVKNGIGVSIMPLNAANYARLHSCRIVDLDIMRTIEIVTVSGRKLRPAVKAFIDFLADFDWGAPISASEPVNGNANKNACTR